MGPNGIGSRACRFASAGIEHEYVVDDTVAVAVIFPEVDFVVEGTAGFDNHFFGGLIVAVEVVCSVIAARVGELYGAVEVELRHEFTGTVFDKPVAGRPCASVGGIAEVLLVEHRVEIAVRVGIDKPEVVVFDKNDDRFLVAHHRERCPREESCVGAARAVVGPCVESAKHCRSRQLGQHLAVGCGAACRVGRNEAGRHG